MLKCLLYILLLVYTFPSAGSAQELILSTTARSYTTNEQIWVNLSVNNTDIIPGAYKIGIRYPAEQLTYVTILPAENGPFTITPAASVANSIITVAGFQGITDTGTGIVSLATLVFLPATGTVMLDTASFAISSWQVFSPQAQIIDCKIIRQTTSVLLPPLSRHFAPSVSLVKGYLRFTVRNSGRTEVKIVDLTGRIAAVPLPACYCTAGHQAVPIGSMLSSGTYIVSINGTGFTVTKRVEVLR